MSGGEVAEQVIRPTGVLDPVWRCGPPQAKWMICWVRSAIGRPRTSGCGSPPSQSEWPKTSPIICRRMSTGALPPLGDPLDRADRDYPRFAPGGIRRPGGGEPAAGGLDLPEEPVAILDADEEGFRAERSLIQTIVGLPVMWKVLRCFMQTT